MTATLSIDIRIVHQLAVLLCKAGPCSRPPASVLLTRSCSSPQDWQALPMGDTASRASPAGGAWRAAVVPVPAELAHAALEVSEAVLSPEARTRRPAAAAAHGTRVQMDFFVSNGTGQEDRPHPGGSYRCVSPGGFKLHQGRLQPFPRARQPPSMLVGAPASDCGTSLDPCERVNVALQILAVDVISSSSSS